MNSVTAAIKPEWLLKPAQSNHIHAARIDSPKGGFSVAIIGWRERRL
jgi:hypothetical protein